jgi:hypothetical protein
MAPGTPLSAEGVFFGGEAFGFDHRGWKAAPTGKIRTPLGGLREGDGGIRMAERPTS